MVNRCRDKSRDPMPLISIGIPFFNAEDYLLDAIRSVFAQTYQDWELIVVDDGSTDKSLSFARSVTDARVTVHADGTNKGLVYRLNQIAQLARGKYLARMDADDLMLPDRIAKQVGYLEAHSDVDVVDTALYSVDRNDNPRGIRGRGPLHPSLGNVIRRGLLLHATIVGRTEWFRSHPYDPLYVRAEDHELWCRTCSTSSFARVSEPLYVYREASSVQPDKYATSCRTQRQIYRRYGPQALSRGRIAALVLRSHMKVAICKALCALGAEAALLWRRNALLQPDEVKGLRRAIQAIRSTPLPGHANAETSALCL
jgi:glycosyltransferase involved in cell wall biosynthesis